MEKSSSQASLTAKSAEESAEAGAWSKLSFFKRYSTRQLITLVFLGLANFCCAIFISIQAPFYPAEAESKGASATEYGLVFGVFELTAFIVAPIVGKYMAVIGPKTVFTVGLLMAGCSAICFGFLDRIDDHVTFISLSFILRIIESIGQSGFSTAVFSITAAEFPTAVATTFASLETFFGLGQIMGPTVGGALYEVGGFTLPFATMGTVALLVGFFTYCIMPEPQPCQNKDEEAPGVFEILRVPGVFLFVSSTAVACMSIGFLAATLEPHIREFGLSPAVVGAVFIISGGLYAITAPLIGWLCDRWLNQYMVSLAGSVLIFTSFLFIGPVPFMPFEKSLGLVCTSLVIHGLGLGPAFVTAFNLTLKEAVEQGGFQNNLNTYGICSGLWLSSLGLGSFIGPSVGGYLLDHVGFERGCYFILVNQAILSFVILAFILNRRRKQRHLQALNDAANADETDPLISSSALLEKDDVPNSKYDNAKASGSYGSV